MIAFVVCDVNIINGCKFKCRISKWEKLTTFGRLKLLHITTGSSTGSFEYFIQILKNGNKLNTFLRKNFKVIN